MQVWSVPLTAPSPTPEAALTSRLKMVIRRSPAEIPACTSNSVPGAQGEGVGLLNEGDGLFLGAIKIWFGTEYKVQ
jgi:hypothetical protein